VVFLNPFVWSDAVDPADAVSRGEFTSSAAATLKAGTHIALFGPRGTGKTTFIGQLAAELAVDHSDDAPPWELIRIDLRRVISPAAFIGAVIDAARTHTSLARRALSEFRRLEREIGINLGVVKAGARLRGVQINDTEILHAQLSALSRLSPRLVIAFDEFQRLAHCPGEPLSIIRSALMGPGRAGHVTLLLTGSLRDKLRLMLHTSTEPIWDQTYDLELPDLDPAELADYLELRFAASGKPASSGAIEHLLTLTDCHPKRTQHVAFHVWEAAPDGATVDAPTVQTAFDALLASGRDNTDFAQIIDTLLSGDDTDVNDAKALFLLVGGASPGSEKDARRYGLPDNRATTRALERLRDRGYVTRTGRQWRIVDPLLAAWLQTQDPLSSE
jgi:energy-coupling factor transporter ATP-binding protein EcfA2